MPRIRRLSVFCTAVVLGISFTATADRYTDYIRQYSDLAVAQQKQYGIPASITLAQGLLESAAGQSTLATKGNNHFGIKCHSDWKGDTLLRSDDAPDECFRSYRTADESFHDHSRFLLRKRYSPLFLLDSSDYAAWAQGLRQCGYATDPNYASRLITIIERYALNLFDTEAGRAAEEDAMFIRDMLVKTHPVRRSRGLHYVIAAPGDTYSSLAREFNISKKKLMAYNDAGQDREIKAWEEVYLQEKLDRASGDSRSAVIGEGESMHSLSQRFGIKLESLRRANPGAKDRPGTRLILP